MTQKKWWQALYLLFLVVTPIIFLFLPADFFDSGPTICPSKRFFNLECFGCGMTRAVMHLIHLDIDTAVYYNVGSLIITPFLALFWLKWTWLAARPFLSRNPA
jgi:hypothetical protein